MYFYFSFVGCVVLVIGGSCGIGQMIVQGFFEVGVCVFICVCDVEVCVDIVICFLVYGDCQVIFVDFFSEVGVWCLVQVFGGFSVWLDILVNNVGISWGVVLESYLVFGWEKVMQFNVILVFFCIQ